MPCVPDCLSVVKPARSVASGRPSNRTSRYGGCDWSGETDAGVDTATEHGTRAAAVSQSLLV